MRALNTRTGRFMEIDPETYVRYVILSYTWAPEGEQTYQDVLRIQSSILYRIESVLLWACIHAWCGSLVFLSFLLNTVYHMTPFVWRISCPRYFTTLLPQAGRRTGTGRWLSGGPWRRWARALQANAGQSCHWNSIYLSHRLSAKVRQACAVARADGYDLIWIDSCCINKESSSELSEAINSMYRWYGRAARCYAFLADVPDLKEEGPRAKGSSFRESRWFTRGWTLQELVAPRDVVFLSKRWNVLGSQFSLADLVEPITGIELPVLVRLKSLDEVSVATRMSWAAGRMTTRVEDRACSLFGIFGVNMSTLYGEGELAFHRLQLAILERIPDQSIFAWQNMYEKPDLRLFPLQSSDDANRADIDTSCLYVMEYDNGISLLASSTQFFRYTEHIRPIPHHIIAHYSPASVSVPTIASNTILPLPHVTTVPG